MHSLFKTICSTSLWSACWHAFLRTFISSRVFCIFWVLKPQISWPTPQQLSTAEMTPYIEQDAMEEEGRPFPLWHMLPALKTCTTSVSWALFSCGHYIFSKLQCTLRELRKDKHVFPSLHGSFMFKQLLYWAKYLLFMHCICLSFTEYLGKTHLSELPDYTLEHYLNNAY